ncbi:calcium-binding protein [Rhodobacter capsulatus]|uniref:calcium-binding protein n=1 Tax=Rhodobacter capsulatus TaxID=1061 RepID=UPI000424F832|nr:calcium-binding protein [Rhodobacter capsulatus]
MTNQVNLTIASGTGVSEAIDSSMFGVNTLFNRDDNNQAAFWEACQRSGTALIRYPGGTITEQYFDLENPDATVSLNYFDIAAGASNVQTTTNLGFSSFLVNVANAGDQAVIVLPTYRYFDQETRTLAAGAEEIIRNFVLSALAQSNGGADISAFEIGNEWYQQNFNWTPEEFGAFQAEYARIVCEAIDSVAPEHRPGVFVQAGQSTFQDLILSSYFQGANSPEIAGVIMHFYITNSNGNPLAMGGGIQDRLNMVNDHWSDFVDDLQVAITEWNVGSNGPSDTPVSGMMRGSALLRLFYEMAKGGVDIATIWTTISPGPSGLWTDERGETHPYEAQTGVLFRLMAESLIGYHAATPPQNIFLYNTSGQKVGYNFLYSHGRDDVLYIASGVNEPITTNLNVSQITAASTYAYVIIIGCAPGEAPDDYYSRTSTRIITNIQLNLDANGAFIRGFELQPYEVAEFHFVDGHGVSINGDMNFEVVDNITGTRFSDTLKGFGGNDRIDGGTGADLIDGGIGNDTLSGGDGNDAILCGPGYDVVNAGTGNDSIDGGEGADTIYAMGGNDVVYADNGDIVISGAGNDTIEATGAGINVEGGEGEDLLSMSGLHSGVSIWIDHGSVEVLETHQLINFSSIESFRGTDMNDNVTIHQGTADCDLGGGNDNALYGAAASGEARLGAGDDFAMIFGSDVIVLGGSGTDRMLVFSDCTVAGGLGDDIIGAFQNDFTVLYELGDGRDIIQGSSVSRTNLQLGASAQAALDSGHAFIESTVNGARLCFDDGGMITFSGLSSSELERII